MLIACPQCEKNFDVDASLIPDQGRLLQCGFCSHKWFYENNNISNQQLLLKSTASIKITTDNDIPKDTENIIKQAEKEIDFQNNELNDRNIINTANHNIISKIFSYTVVGIISFVAFIILIDTFQTPLTILFPKLDYFLISLYETLKDIELFIIDLS